MAQIITELPSFFKVLVAKDFTTQLQIPQAFVKTFSELLISNQFYLHTHSANHFWEVEVEIFNERTYFTKGWEEFVKDNLLEFQDFVVFKYVDPSSFKVETYGPHGCAKRVKAEKEKESPKIHKKNKRKREEEEEEEEEEEVMKRMKHQKARTSTHQNENDDSKEHVKRSIALAQEEVRRFKSNHPFFQVDLQPSYVNSFMYVPTKFYKAYLKGKVEEVELEVSGRVWSVGLISVHGSQKSKCNYAKLSRGWRGFFEENKLKAGDVCIFEMKKRSNFQVHIFRC